MNTSKTKLFAVLMSGVAVFASQTVIAGGFNFSGGGGGGGNGGGGNNKGSKSSFKFDSNNGNKHNNHNYSNYNKKHHDCHDDYYHRPHYRVRYVEPVRLVYSQCYHPQFQNCYVYPGDTWYSISKRNYGVDFLCRHIATYNGLGMSSQLVAGQRLRMPVVNANGSLATSNAPVAAPFVAPAEPVAAASQAETTPAGSDEPSRPSVAVGSTMQFSGESLGAEKGSVRLQISGVTLPVEVIEWTAESVKVHIPKLDLSRTVAAELEVLRADGSMASTSGVELMPAETRVALGN